MAFRGVTFSGQNVTPKNDGALYNAHFGDGIIEGCSMNISGDDLVIQSGHIVACGRVCQVEGATSVDLSGRTLQTGYIQIILNYDLTQGEGQQWYSTFVESATTTFPALTQEDINTPSGTLYQLQLAVVQISGGALSIYSTMGYSPLKALADVLIESGNVLITRSGEPKGRMFANASSFNVGKTDANGNYQNGLAIDSLDALILSALGGGIYLRPNGPADPTGQVNINTDGQQIGGHPMTPREPSGGATLTASMSQITSLSAGIESAGVYLVTAEVDYTPASAVAHYPQLEIQGSIKNTYYTATAGARHFLLSGIVTGLSSLVLRGTTGTGSTNATVSNIKLHVVRLS